MEQIDDNLQFRWFVGLDRDARVWDASTFSKNRDRLLEADVARGLDQREHLLGRLHAVHCLLNRGIEVLHAEAQSVEAQFAKVSRRLSSMCGGRFQWNIRHPAQKRSCA